MNLPLVGIGGLCIFVVWTVLDRVFGIVAILVLLGDPWDQIRVPLPSFLAILPNVAFIVCFTLLFYVQHVGGKGKKGAVQFGLLLGIMLAIGFAGDQKESNNTMPLFLYLTVFVGMVAKILLGTLILYWLAWAWAGGSGPTTAAPATADTTQSPPA
jgi:hypothetical protein